MIFFGKHNNFFQTIEPQVGTYYLFNCFLLCTLYDYKIGNIIFSQILQIFYYLYTGLPV